MAKTECPTRRNPPPRGQAMIPTCRKASPALMRTFRRVGKSLFDQKQRIRRVGMVPQLVVGLSDTSDDKKDSPEEFPFEAICLFSLHFFVVQT